MEWEFSLFAYRLMQVGEALQDRPIVCLFLGNRLDEAFWHADIWFCVMRLSDLDHAGGVKSGVRRLRPH